MLYQVKSCMSASIIHCMTFERIQQVIEKIHVVVLAAKARSPLPASCNG